MKRTFFGGRVINCTDAPVLIESEGEQFTLEPGIDSKTLTSDVDYVTLNAEWFQLHGEWKLLVLDDFGLGHKLEDAGGPWFLRNLIVRCIYEVYKWVR